MEVRLEVNMVAALVTDQVLEVVLEACLGAYSVVDRYGVYGHDPKGNALTASSITSQTLAATTATLVPRQAERTPAPRHRLPTTPALKAVNTAAVLQATRVTHRLRPDNNMVRVKPTEVTAHNNTPHSHSMVSNTVTDRKLASVDNQDTVGQHQVTVKDHHRQAHQAAMDNKV